MLEGPPERPGADLGHPAVRVVAHHDAGRVARQPAGRLCGNVGAVLEGGLSWGVGVGRHVGFGQDRGIDVDDDLVPLAGWPRIDPVMEDRLGEQGQRVGLPLAERRRFRGNVVERSRGNVFRLSVQRLAGRVERLHQHGPGLRLRLRLDIRGRAIVARFRIFRRAHIFASLGPDAPR